jgi:NADH-quinone oxidoreductase subunit M
MVILSSFQANFWFAFLAALTLIFGAAYSLWMVKRVVFGEVKNESVSQLNDLNVREYFILAVLAVAVLIMGIYPEPVVDVMRVTVEHLIQQISVSKV